MIKLQTDFVQRHIDESGREYWLGVHTGAAMPADMQFAVVCGVDGRTGEGADAIISHTGRVELWAEGRSSISARLLYRITRRARQVARQLGGEVCL